ncbi:MAG: protein kinase, partial [Planctomycetota bacterium]
MPRRRRHRHSESSTGFGSDSALESSVESELEKVEPGFFEDPLVGRTLGKCRIERYVGEGRTGTVYRAHYEPLRRTVAVKILKPEVAKVPEVLANFQREGRAVARLDHENILRIYDVAEEEGRHSMVLELRRGRNLLEIL